MSRPPRRSGRRGAESAGPPPARPFADPPLVLVVDDSADQRTIYSRYLRAHGFRVEVAVNGLEALVQAQKLLPAVIVMDLALPHVDGWEATRRLKAGPSTRHIPIVACTGQVTGASAERALEAGCDAYLTKPCLPEDLLAEIRRLLGTGQTPP